MICTIYWAIFIILLNTIICLWQKQKQKSRYTNDSINQVLEECQGMCGNSISVVYIIKSQLCKKKHFLPLLPDNTEYQGFQLVEVWLKKLYFYFYSIYNEWQIRVERWATQEYLISIKACIRNVLFLVMLVLCHWKLQLKHYQIIIISKSHN